MCIALAHSLREREREMVFAFVYICAHVCGVEVCMWMCLTFISFNHLVLYVDLFFFLYCVILTLSTSVCVWRGEECGVRAGAWVSVCICCYWIFTPICLKRKTMLWNGKFLINVHVCVLNFHSVLVLDVGLCFILEHYSVYNNNNVHLSCAHQCPERSHDTY